MRDGIFFVLLIVTRLVADSFVLSLDAVYRNSEIRIDGLLEEAVWQNVQPATRFVQREPVEGAPENISILKFNYWFGM